jgi:hypothetical protein
VGVGKVQGKLLNARLALYRCVRQWNTNYTYMGFCQWNTNYTYTGENYSEIERVEREVSVNGRQKDSS